MNGGQLGDGRLIDGMDGAAAGRTAAGYVGRPRTAGNGTANYPLAFASGPVKLFERSEQEVDVRRELDSLVTQMHSSGIRYEDAVREFKRQYLREVLIAHRGNQCKAAEELGMHRNTLSRTMADLGLELAEVRAGLKRPPRPERPVYGALRQGYR
jgi:Fis family transcriptional regulator, factor for inversion stimulation protein